MCQQRNIEQLEERMNYNLLKINTYMHIYIKKLENHFKKIKFLRNYLSKLDFGLVYIHTCNLVDSL